MIKNKRLLLVYIFAALICVIGVSIQQKISFLSLKFYGFLILAVIGGIAWFFIEKFINFLKKL